MTNPTGITHGQSSTSYRVIITGSRTWTFETPIWTALDDLLDQHSQLTIIHGGAAGADRAASRWVTAQLDWSNWPPTEQIYYPNWLRYGRQAGILRNLAMIQAGADLCLAFIRDQSPGATHCAQAAQAAGIPTTIHRWPTT